MSSRPRAAMIEQTRARLIASARQAFARLGYAKTSMDDLTAEAGLTRGALYHHFGDKQGLLAAVVEQIDSEMDERLEAISAAASDPWQGFAQRCRAYLEMAQEAEIRRIVLQDARAVLGQRQPAEEHCIDSLSRRLQALVEAGLITPAPSQALARLINGSLVDAALWIAAAEQPGQRLQQALQALELLLRGLQPPR
ncbi:TetR/AcrR family transcriptional regulator [Pseudomonas protegens]|jgi:AcrR family transcriptional regulator|uniref:Transcriptional regulator, TetR family n=3 Tax=Pseudomonas protegens TaxID=380021 RepID=Q4K987_PSEF5|nr:MULTISPECIES: TetR/AcrR family transcriptional regulator [Pseudomonas]GED79384.1 TetR family transcriptional regulator [Pseudomonas fluorescens]AAY93360.1 transcriptional regulator, TetR family [Pseudomonas protegens Pf-5]AGL85922.1 transcriptional regulator, TetR family [Pseudomonas protegens CHA0]AQT11040.1 TetR family transcriptional regulator [Pseudomonas protegens]ASE22467.1 TetR/AcrR family transcriptional regulator [Pseudomonas protegens]